MKGWLTWKAYEIMFRCASNLIDNFLHPSYNACASLYHTSHQDNEPTGPSFDYLFGKPGLPATPPTYLRIDNLRGI